MAANIRYMHGEKGKDILPTYYYQSTLLHAGHERKLFLGDQASKVCRFCLRDSALTSFRQDAHVLPEFMGNKVLFSHFECDECNSLFSKYENAFTNYFGIHHTFSRLKGKTKIPKYKSEKEGFSVEAREEDIGMFSSNGNDSVRIDHKENKINIETIRPSYIPNQVLKCLVKIGFCAIPNTDLPFLEQTRKWLRGELDDKTFKGHPLFIVYYNIGGGLLSKFPFAAVLSKRDNRSVPQTTVMICYDRFKFQFFMPFDIRDAKLFERQEVQLPIQDQLMRIREDGKGLTFFWKDFSGFEKVVGEKYTFSMGFEDGTPL